MAGGRPPKYDPDKHCEQIVELGAEGASKAQMARDMGVSRDTIYAWAEEHPEFSDALSRALELSQSWWEEQARMGVWSGSQFNANLWKFIMANRYRADYAERREHDHTSADGSMSPKNIIVKGGGD